MTDGKNLKDTDRQKGTGRMSKKAVCGFIFHRLLGWKARLGVPNYDKCVICAAPHTSNWDFLIGKLFYGTLGREACFLMKKEWFFFPLSLLLRAAGGIPVNRDKRTSMVEQMAARFAASARFHLAITPEGTRKANPKWKKGFYYIALEAQVPIVLVGVDYASKTIHATRTVIPSGDFGKDMREIKLYFKAFRGRHPSNFTTGNV